MLVKKTALLASVAAAALMIAPGGAFAFEDVSWEWDKYVDETVEIDIDIDGDFLPSGMVEVEKLQMFFGDVTATATAYGIHNRAGGTVNGELGIVDVPVSGAGTFDLVYVDPADNNNPDGAAGEVIETTINDATGLALTLNGGSADENTNTIADVNYSIDGFVSVDLGDVELGVIKNALDLPKVQNAATAVGNNQDIYSSSALFLHDAQFAFGAINSPTSDTGTFENASWDATLLGNSDGGNLHTDLVVLGVLAAATGFIEPAEITATAYAFDILNASVENTATAVGNNASFEIATLMKPTYETVVTPGGVDTSTQSHQLSVPQLVSGDGSGNVDFGFDDGTVGFEGSTEDGLVVDVLTLTTPDGGPNSVDIDYLTQDDSYVDTQTESFRAETDIIVKTDAVMIADLTQLLIGNVTATATTGPEYSEGIERGLDWNGKIGEYSNILIDGYEGFGEAGFGNLAPSTFAGTDYVQTALVKNVATAVGNNLTIKVDGCNVCDLTNPIQ